MVCGSLNSPRPEPLLPHSLTNFPSFVNLTTRLFLPLRWLSVTKMSPFGATDHIGRLVEEVGAAPATPALPSVISTLPSGLNLKTW